MSGPKTRARLASRIALLGAALALATVGCTEDEPGAETQLDRRQDQLASAAIYQFLRPPDTPRSECTTTLTATGAGDEALIQAAVDAAEAFDVICLAPGTYAMSDGVVVGAPASLTIRGLGAEPVDVELDFDGQAFDSSSFDVTAPGFWLENLWVHNPALVGVELRSSNAEDDPAVLRKVKLSWGADDSLPFPANGLAGVIIRGSQYVIVEFSEIIGGVISGLTIDEASSDVIVRNNYPRGNHVGITVTSSSDVELVSNAVTDNTTGILALQDPATPMVRNQNLLLFRNEVFSNNRPKFTVALGLESVAPVGAGVMIVGGTDIELRQNWIYDNTSTGLLLLANCTADGLFSAPYQACSGVAYDDPYPTNIFSNENIYEFDAENDFFQDEAFNGLPVDTDFIADWNAMNALVGSPSYSPIPPCMADDPSTNVGGVYPGCLANEANDPNTPFIAELINRPIILDGTELDFEGVEGADPTLCFGTGLEDPAPIVYMSLAARRGYPDGSDPGRQADFDCDLPELPRLSFP